MSFLKPNLVDLRPSDDRQAGKLAKSSFRADFSNNRSGKLQGSGMSFGDVAGGVVVTDRFTAEATSKRVGLSLPETGSIGYRLGDAPHDAGGFDALLLQKGAGKSAVSILQDVRSRT
ncbi:hypothetical protein [Marivita sp.]|uniref:hypothetical protein n=1 Tax=Marivita sp. TaxID=2003365 RepID=UPI003F6B5E39